MIRNLRLQDKQIYLALAAEFYASPAVLSPVPQSHFEATFSELMRSDVYAEGFLLEREGEAAGYALVAKTFSQEAGGLVVWLEELYIREAYRGRGLGREFFAFLEGRYPTAKRFRLEAEEDNVRAIGLYRRIGYRILPYAQMIKGE